MNPVFIFFYDIAIRIYGALIWFASWRNEKAKRWIEGRKNLLQLIQNSIQSGDKIIWMHCASVGEFEQGRPVIEKLKQKFPEKKILLTFFSPSGYELRKNYSGADYVFYLPLDTRRNAKQFISIVNPELAIFVKYEFWFHFLNSLNKKNIPAILVSGIFRPQQFFFSWYGKSFLKVLRTFKKIFVQDVDSLQLLSSNGFLNAELSGDTRFDRVIDVKNNFTAIPPLERFCSNSKVIVAGSTWAADEDLLIDFINHHPENNCKWIFVPHEVNEAGISSLEKKLLGNAVRFSKSSESDSEKKFLIVDQVGMLSRIYHYADVAYVGGGFGKGIHNILEAAVYGVPVIFGPNHSKFREAVEITEKKFCFSIQNENQLADIVSQLFSNEKFYSACSSGCEKYVSEKSGATEQVVNYITNKIFSSQ